MGADIPSWIFHAESLGTELEDAFSDAKLTLTLCGDVVGSAVVDLAIEGGWKGRGADAAALAVDGVSAKFTDLAISCQTASQLSHKYSTKLGKICDELSTLQSDLIDTEDDLEEAREKSSKSPGGVVGIGGGSLKETAEVGRINGKIEEKVAEAIAYDYAYGNSISLTLDAIVKNVNTLYGPSDVINVDGSPFEQILRDNEIFPTVAPSCQAIEPDERLKVHGPLEPPWDEEEKDSDDWGLLDWVQGALDVIGLVPGFGEIADGANVIISGGRAIFDPENRGEHLTNMALSGGAMIPFAGWGATAGKFGRYADEAAEVADSTNDIRRTIKGVDETTETVFKSKYGMDELPDGFKVEDGKIVDPNGNWMDKTGRWRRPDGKFAKDPLGDVGGIDRVPASRKTHDTVWKRQLDENGNLTDGNGNPLDPDWVDLGHKRGFENWRLRDKYRNGEITLEEWKKIADDPDIYKYEDRTVNRSHRDELKTPDSPALDKYLRDKGYID